MQQYKLSVGIALDATLQKTIKKQLQPHEYLPVHFYMPESYQIPLLALGWRRADDISTVQEQLDQALAALGAFDVQFTKIGYDAKESKDAKRIVLHGEHTDALLALQEALEEAFGVVHAKRKSFAPRVGLGKIRAKLWALLDDAPEISIPFDVLYDVTGVSLFAEYNDHGERVREALHTTTLSY